jgi:hypothetical protein
VNTDPIDDTSISDAAELLRRISVHWWVFDDRTGRRRLSSAAFENSRDGSGTSVAIAAETSPDELLNGYVGYGLASLTAGKAREQQQRVCRVPLDDMPWHAQIEGRKTGSIKKALSSACKILVEPTSDSF